VNAKTLNVAGTATLAGASVLGAVNVKNGGQLTLSGAVDAGDIAVDNTAVKEADAKATTLTIGSADATNVVAAKSLTVKGIAQNSGGSAVVSGNAVSIDTVTVGRFGTFELNAKELTVKDLTVGGELASDNTNAQNATLTLTSGSLTAENITIGAYSTTTNTANVDITTKTLSVKGADKNLAQISLSGDNEVGTLTVGNFGKVTVGGSAEIGTITLAAESKTGAKDNGLLSLSDGAYVITTSDQLFKPVAEKTGIEAIGALKTGITNDSTNAGSVVLRLNDAEFNYTLEQYQALLKNTGTKQAKVELANALLVGASTDTHKKGTFADAKEVGYTGKSAIAAYQDSDTPAVAVKGEMVIGSLELAPNASTTQKYTTFTIGEDSTGTGNKLILRGDAEGKVLYTNALKDETKPLEVTLDVETQFGEDDIDGIDKGSTDAKITTTKNFTVAETGDLTLTQDLTLGNGGSLDVYGRFAGKNVVVAGTTRAGEASHVYGGVMVLEGTAPDLKKNEVGQQVSTGNVTVGSNGATVDSEKKGGLLVIGSANESAALAYQADHVLDNTLWVGQAVNFTDGVQLGNAESTGVGTENEVNGKKTVAIDMAALAASGYAPAADKAVIAFASKTPTNIAVDKVVLANLRQVGNSVLVYDDVNKAYYANVGAVAATPSDPDVRNSGTRIDVGTQLYQAYDVVTADGKAYLVKDADVMAEVKSLGLHSQAVIEDEIDQVKFGNAVADTFIFDIFGTTTSNPYLKSAEEAWDKYAEKNGAEWTPEERDREEEAFFAPVIDTIVKAENAATNMAVEGGAFTAALDYQNEVVSALDRRTTITNLNSARGEVGVTPWVDVFGTTNEAKRLYGSNAGYEADIYGAVLGFDYTAACGGVLGVAFNVGTGDGNSVGDGAKVDNDADYYGFSVYAAKQFGSFNVKADLGYTQASNDLSTTNVLGSFKESLDADLWTFGVGSEFLLQAGSVNVVPHAGIRMTRLSMDDSKYGADYDDMTVYQLPLGVAVSSTFETNGWKLAPMADVSVVPTFGDKDAVATYFGGITETTRVVDTNPVQGTLGVEAQNGAFTFGLNYRLTAGGDDRMNNSFNANVRYAF